MTSTDISPSTERLPPELLEKVLAYVPVQDILRMKQINRKFHDLIQASPYINYRVDLFAAGLVDNPAVDLSLADKRRALDEYRTKWDTLNPTMAWGKQFGGVFSSRGFQARASGVLGFVFGHKRSIRFLKLGSVLRGIPREVWKVSLPPNFSLHSFAICPQADVLALLGWGRTIDSVPSPWVHILSMTTGEPHPDAELANFSCPIISPSDSCASITNSRFAIIVKNDQKSREELHVWDWRTGKSLVKVMAYHYFDLCFLDEYALAVFSIDGGRYSQAELCVFDTRSTLKPSKETSFTLPSGVRYSLSSGECDHIPTPEELRVAPFYSDPSQRILALIAHGLPSLIVNTERLLKLARKYRGKSLYFHGWEQAIEVSVNKIELVYWVSGCRLFQAGSNFELFCLHVYDFSRANRAKNLVVDEGEGGKWMSSSTGSCSLPLSSAECALVASGHDSILFGLDEWEHLDIHAYSL